MIIYVRKPLEHHDGGCRSRVHGNGRPRSRENNRPKPNRRAVRPPQRSITEVCANAQWGSFSDAGLPVQGWIEKPASDADIDNGGQSPCRSGWIHHRPHLLLLLAIAIG